MKGIEELLSILGGPGLNREPVDITGEDYGSRVCRAMGMEGTNPMARRAVGKDREAVIAEFGKTGGNAEVYEYVDQTDDPNPVGFEEFVSKRRFEKIPEYLRLILGAFTEGGKFDPERPGFGGEPLKTNSGYAKFIANFAQRVEMTAEALDRAITTKATIRGSLDHDEQDHGTIVVDL
jgi:hypothetical protein